MKITLMREQLRGRDMLQRDRVVGGVCDHGVAGYIIVCCGQQCGEVRKYSLAELKSVRHGHKMGKADLAVIRREHERVVRGQVGDLVCGSGLARRCRGDDQRSAVAVIREMEAVLRILAEEMERRVGRAVGYGKHAGGTVEGGINRAGVEAAQVDLISARGAVGGETDHLSAECGRLLQRQCGAVKCSWPGWCGNR